MFDLFTILFYYFEVFFSAWQALLSPPRSLRHLLLRVSGPDGDQPAGDGRHHQRAPHQLHKVPRRAPLGAGGGPGLHRPAHLLQVARGNHFCGPGEAGQLGDPCHPATRPINTGAPKPKQ